MIIVVCGATASYKTRLSVDLAKRYNGIVVNADSLQVYKELDIATAKIKEEEKEGIPHYLFDIANSCIQRNGELIESFEECPNDKYMEELRFFYSLMQGENENTNNIKHAIHVMKVACSED